MNAPLAVILMLFATTAGAAPNKVLPRVIAGDVLGASLPGPQSTCASCRPGEGIHASYSAADGAHLLEALSLEAFGPTQGVEVYSFNTRIQSFLFSLKGDHTAIASALARRFGKPAVKRTPARGSCERTVDYLWTTGDTSLLVERYGNRDWVMLSLRSTSITRQLELLPPYGPPDPCVP
jgi:hypothetical protein